MKNTSCYWKLSFWSHKNHFCEHQFTHFSLTYIPWCYSHIFPLLRLERSVSTTTPSHVLQSSSDTYCPALALRSRTESQSHTKNLLCLLIVRDFIHILRPNLSPFILVTVPGLHLGVQCESKSNSSSLSQPRTHPSQLSDTPGPSLFPANQPSLYPGFRWYVSKFPQHFGYVFINTLPFVHDK